MISQTLDKRYKIIRKLGSGGFGEAFLAKDICLHGIFCVVKQLKPIDKSEQVLKIARRLFVTESETLLRLGKHDQIPTLLAHLEKKKDFFLVQEFIDGHPLSAEIKVNQPWAIDDVVDLLASALEPLAFAHTNNVIHRDIKPDNLMRRHSDGKVVLIDFGAVKEVINSSQIAGKPVLTVCIGTPGYMPIEQASGNPKFSSDIYALGITCIQSLTGLSAQELDPISWRHLIYTYPILILVYIYVAWLSSFRSPYLLIDVDYECEWQEAQKKQNEKRDELQRWEKYVKESLKEKSITGEYLLWLFCNLAILCIANLISWNIVSNSIGETILRGFVFQKEKLDYLNIISTLPILQSAIYGMMMSVIIVVLTNFRESDKNR